LKLCSTRYWVIENILTYS